MAGLAVLQKPQLLRDGDVLQIYGEVNVDGDPELGATLVVELHLPVR